MDEVLGAKRDIDYEDLGKLTYLSQVLWECRKIPVTCLVALVPYHETAKRTPTLLKF